MLTIHFNIVEHDDHVEVIRTHVPFDIAGDLYERCVSTFEVLDRFRHHGLLLDLRGVTAGVGPDFEQKITRVRQSLTRGHPRVAFLVETPLGRLQVSEQLRADEAGSHIRVFSDEQVAREFARGVLDSSPLQT